MFENINFGLGVEKKQINRNLSPEKSLNLQIDNLAEDILQVRYKNSYCIDVGWYTEFDISGKFIVLIIKEEDWTSPLCKMTCKELCDLEKIVIDCIGIVQKQKFVC